MTQIIDIIEAPLHSSEIREKMHSMKLRITALENEIMRQKDLTDLMLETLTLVARKANGKPGV